MDWYLAALKKYAEFSGRARRKEYWLFFLFNLLAVLGLSFVDVVSGLYSKALGAGLFGGAYSLLVLLPSIAVSVRRLHDTGRSAWWLLLALVPMLGPLALIVIYCLDGTPGENKYGADPKAAAPEAPAYPVPPPPPAV
ncbi:MAG: hypothetical protein A2X32_02270 [Elusimicrobia bacterium GWC2_64_44]|nr:MAG: hypothetical protein A2X32_02270 [Elusimicrobia bacterium GWC2_64_44]